MSKGERVLQVVRLKLDADGDVLERSAKSLVAPETVFDDIIEYTRGDIARKVLPSLSAYPHRLTVDIGGGFALEYEGDAADIRPFFALLVPRIDRRGSGRGIIKYSERNLAAFDARTVIARCVDLKASESTLSKLRTLDENDFLALLDLSVAPPSRPLTELVEDLHGTLKELQDDKEWQKFMAG